MKIDFEKKFEEKILARGREYYEGCAVQDVHVVDDLVTARIRGTRNYEAFVQLKHGELIEAGCSCPYDAYCKHIAALLYYLENENLETLAKEQSSKELQLLETIRKIDKKELEKFLVDLLTRDEDIYDEFRKKFDNLFSPLSLSEYKRKIRMGISKVAGRDGFIDYEESWDYTHEMHKILDEVHQLVENRYYELAFDVVTSMLDTIPHTDIDDSNGSTGDVAESCIEIIESVLDKTLLNDEVLSQKILKYILHELETNALSNYGIELYGLLGYYIENEVFLDEITEKLLGILEVGKTKKYFWYARHYVDYLMDIYNKTGQENKILDLLKEYSNDKDVCFKLVDEYLKQGEASKAIELLKGKLDDENARSIAERLADIYDSENMLDEYKDILYKLFYELDKYNIDVYKKIKKLFSQKDWLVERQTIIDKVLQGEKGYHRRIFDIYIEEEMFDVLFNLVRNCGIDTIISYEKYLLPKYNKELIWIYAENCRAFAQTANNRKLYRELAGNLSHIKRMKDSSREFKQLMQEIQEQFRNKPAMKDELKGLYEDV